MVALVADHFVLDWVTLPHPLYLRSIPSLSHPMVVQIMIPVPQGPYHRRILRIIQLNEPNSTLPPKVAIPVPQAAGQ